MTRIKETKRTIFLWGDGVVPLDEVKAQGGHASVATVSCELEPGDNLGNNAGWNIKQDWNESLWNFLNRLIISSYPSLKNE